MARGESLLRNVLPTELRSHDFDLFSVISPRPTKTYATNDLRRHGHRHCNDLQLPPRSSRAPDQGIRLRCIGRLHVPRIPFQLFADPVGHVAEVVRFGEQP